MSTIFGRKYSRGLLRLVSRRTRKRRNQRHQRSKGTKHCEQLLDKCRKIKGRQAQPQRDWTGHVTDNNRCIDSGCQCYLFMATIDVITSEWFRPPSRASVGRRRRELPDHSRHRESHRLKLSLIYFSPTFLSPLAAVSQCFWCVLATRKGNNRMKYDTLKAL